MSELRKELNRRKEEKEKAINESAYKWLEENVILINEKINHRTIEKFSNNINKFDQTFGPYKEKIPALANKLAMAESELEQVMTGTVSDKKAADMLGRLSYLYSTLSKFFNTDLPILLKTPTFSAAREYPDFRLDNLRPMNGMKHDPNVIKNAFKHALEPSKEDKKLRKKIYHGRNIPVVNYDDIASQLLVLTYDDLQELTKAGKVPMVAVAEPEKPVGESVEHTQEQLQEALDTEKLKKLDNEFKKIRNLFNAYGDRMPETKKVLDSVDEKINDVLTDFKAGAVDSLKGIFGRGVEADIMNIYKMFSDFNRTWPAIRGRLGDMNPDTPMNTAEGDLSGRANQIEAMLRKAFAKPLFSFKKQTIDPMTFTDELMALTPNELDSITKGISPPEPEDIAPSGLDDLDLADPKNTSAPEAADKGELPKDTKSSIAGKETQRYGSPGTAVDPEIASLTKDIGDKTGVPEGPERVELNKMIQGILDAGFKIEPK